MGQGQLYDVQHRECRVLPLGHNNLLPQCYIQAWESCLDKKDLGVLGDSWLTVSQQ